MAESTESDRKNALSDARARRPLSDDRKAAKNVVMAVATPWGFLSLLKYIDILGDMPFMAAFGAAILKDILDFAIVGEIPGMGVLFTMFVGMMFFLAGAGKKSKLAKNFIRRIISLILAVIVEDIPGLAIIPTETVMVGVNYMWTLAERKNEADSAHNIASDQTNYDGEQVSAGSQASPDYSRQRNNELAAAAENRAASAVRLKEASQMASMANVAAVAGEAQKMESAQGGTNIGHQGSQVKPESHVTNSAQITPNADESIPNIIGNNKVGTNNLGKNIAGGSSDMGDIEKNEEKSETLSNSKREVKYAEKITNPEAVKAISENSESEVEKANIIGVVKDKNFEGSVIVKTEDNEGRVVGYALRKNSNGELEGNKIGYMKDGSVGAVYQLHESDFAKLGEKGILEKYENTSPEALEDQQESTTESGLNEIIKEEKPAESDNKDEKIIVDKEKKELDNKLMDYYIQKSKFENKEIALQKLMAYIGVESLDELNDKMNQKDEDGDEIRIFNPDDLGVMGKPSMGLLRKIREGGSALGYTFLNTPGYELAIDTLVDSMRSNGKTEDADEVEKIFKEDRLDFEKEKDKSEFQKIDEGLMMLPKDEEKFKEFVDGQKNLPPDAIVHLYHGLNNGGYDMALDVLNGTSQGVEQHSGPTVSLVPAAAFWKGVGFRYALRRDQIEFPGESNPNAVVRMEKNSLGSESDGKIIHKSGALSLDQFEAEIMRSQAVLPSPELEKEIVDKLQHFSEERSLRKNT